MKHILFAAFFISTVMFGQTPAPKQAISNPPSTMRTHPDTPNVPVHITTSGPKGVIIVPMPITYGDAKIPGDSEVLVKLNDILSLNQQYEDEKNRALADLNTKYGKKWEGLQHNLQESIQRVKNANKWGDDVVFSSQTKQWIRLDRAEFEAMKKAKAEQENK